ncbi:MAG: 3-dehydroquinate dehydratase [Actinomycetota bacterium]|jgi:3-dehydroquinate dehydratase-2|nr:3-dehydroquinate dehydratase [Actinomycetota bacterium]
MATILLVSGPNLNLLGDREPDVYGTDTLDELVGDARAVAEGHGHVLEHIQSNHEGDIIDAVQRARDRCAAIVINPGAFTHYSYAIADALAAFPGPTVELHVSNPSAREAWRRTSVVAPVVTGTVAGFGRDGYRLALEATVTLLKETG